jgi:hypothetical protein
MHDYSCCEILAAFVNSVQFVLKPGNNTNEYYMETYVHFWPQLERNSLNICWREIALNKVAEKNETGFLPDKSCIFLGNETRATFMLWHLVMQEPLG